MSSSKTRRVVITSLGSALALPVLVGAQDKPAEAGETVKCYGVNKCKATGDCGGPGHSCANQNSCKRQGYIEMDKETCLRIDGGRLTPNEEKENAKPTEKERE